MIIRVRRFDYEYDFLETFRFDYEYEFDYECNFLETFRFDYEYDFLDSFRFDYEYDFLETFRFDYEYEFNYVEYDVLTFKHEVFSNSCSKLEPRKTTRFDTKKLLSRTWSYEKVVLVFVVVVKVVLGVVEVALVTKSKGL